MSERCPNCDSSKVSEQVVTEWQPYLSLAKAFQATYPVMTCDMCAFGWRDYRAEEAIEAAMEKFLNPEEPFTRADQEALSAEADYWNGVTNGDAA